MRRSFAPSLQSKRSFIPKPKSSEVKGESQDSTRTVSSILNLLNENSINNNTANEPSNSGEIEKALEFPESHSSKSSRNDSEFHSYGDEGENACLPPPGSTNETDKRIFNVVWGKLSKKKHKKWEGDGILEITSHSLVLKDCEGKSLGTRRRTKNDILEEGSRLIVGSKEIELIDMVAEELENKEEKVQQVQCKVQKSKSTQSSAPTFRPHKRPRFSISQIANAKDDLGNDSLIMPSPPAEHQWQYNPSKLPLVDVVVDHCLSRVLRPHQRDGVLFLYECVCGMKNPLKHQTGIQHSWNGCILADEMGLGKTLQCITLIWTVLRKGPYGGKPMFHRVLIVTPSSLVANWQKEFQKWLGKEKIAPFIVNQKNKPKDYAKMPNSRVMVISYEMAVRCIGDLEKISFDILICDEGHRIKNTIIKTSKVLTRLKFKSRILLTGTPIQNDLQEFYSLIDFVNPGILGKSLEFRKHYEEPIVKSREPHCSIEERRLGETRAAELNTRTGWFVLRRTQSVINKYLPGKKEVVIFCAASQLQVRLYKAAIAFWEEQHKKEITDGVPHLTVLTAMKKICNHPKLILESESGEESVNKKLQEQFGPHDMIDFDCSVHSGKLAVLEILLHKLSISKEKVILVSYYTQTLDMFASLCDSKGYTFSRLDGSVSLAKRMNIVDSFNQAHGNTFIFLLSARAGGVGLNLTGASRLVLYDSDWNPASDLQAMARIWRDGQKKSVYIYRFLTTGTIEEKVYQRQINKTGLSGAVVDPHNQSSVKLSPKELRDLFTYHECTPCLTHDLLSCKCNENDADVSDKEESDREIVDHRDCQLNLNSKSVQCSNNPQMNQLHEWKHLFPPFNQFLLEELGLSSATEFLTFIFLNSKQSNNLEL